MARLPWYSMWASDFLNSESVQLMTLGEIGLYIVLLNQAWLHDGLPSDAAMIRRLARNASDAEFDVAWCAVEKHFPIASDGRRRNERQEAERVGSKDKHQSAVDAANARWGKKKGTTADLMAQLGPEFD